jgi:hypothetical protein
MQRVRRREVLSNCGAFARQVGRREGSDPLRGIEWNRGGSAEVPAEIATDWNISECLKPRALTVGLPCSAPLDRRPG